MTITAASYTDHIELDLEPNFDIDLLASSASMFYMWDLQSKRNLIEYHMVHANHNLAVK